MPAPQSCSEAAITTGMVVKKYGVQHNTTEDILRRSPFLVQQPSALQVAKDLTELPLENIILQLKTMGRKIPPLVS